MDAEEARNQDICPNHLLADDPSEQDALGGGHQLTARALVDLVLNSSGGKAFALLGGWGSGKSTVIRLFQKEVEHNPDIRVFVFDAWYHEGDPLRRSFLERLAAFLAEIHWLEGKALEEINSRMDELASRKEETRSQTSPVVTREGTWIGILFTLGVPLGAALLSSQPMYQAPFWFFAVGLLAIFSPIIAALCFMIHNLRTKGRLEFPSLVSQNIQAIRSSTVRTPEPTSVEFEARFREMLNWALTDDRRLVIVVDNLDRLPADQARSVWAAMRTFLEVRGASWSERLWLIVAFDPSAIPHLWRDAQGDGEGDAKKLGEVFISKLFHARLYVPPPVLSDWKAFLVQLLYEALPRHDEEDFYAIYRVYRTFSAGGDRPPAPREIKQFVNLVGNQHRIWQDTIPLPIQALYVVLREKLAENPREVLSGMEAEVKKLFPQEEKWKDYLLAQHFNVEPDKALQVLFLDEIRKGLEAPGSSAFGEAGRLIRREVLGTLVLEALEEAGEWAEKAPEMLAKAALAIKKAQDLLPEEDERQSLMLLRRRATSATRWKVWDKEVVQGLVALVASAGGEEERRSLVEAILRGVERPSGDEIIREAAKGLADFLVRLKGQFGLDAADDFRFPVEQPAEWIVALSALDFWKLHGDVEKAFEPPRPLEVLAELSARVGRGEFGRTEALAVRALSYVVGSGPGWQGLADSLRGRLAIGNRYNDEEIRAAVYALLQLEPVTEEARKVLKGLATGWPLFHHLAYVNSGKTLGTLLLPMLIYNPSAQLQSPAGEASQGVQRYVGFLRNPEGVDLREMTELLAELQVAEETDFSVRAVIQLVVDKHVQETELVAALLRHLEEAHPDAFSPEILLEQGEALGKLLGEDTLSAMYRKWQDKIIQRAQSKGFALDFLPAYRRILGAVGDGPPESFLDFLGEGLKRLQKNDWLRLLQEDSNSDAFALLRQLGARGFPVELDHRLADAIEEAATTLLSDEAAYDSEAIRAYLDFLTRDARNNLSARMALDVSKLLREHRDRGAEKFLEAVGAVILEGATEVRVEHLDDLLLDWLPKAVERLSEAELGWFASLLEKCGDLVPDLEGAIREEAFKRVNEAREADKDGGVGGSLEKIATILQGEGARYED